MKPCPTAILASLSVSLAACVSPDASGVAVTELSAADLPSDVRMLAENAASGFVVAEAQKKVRDGRTYYDVEGELADGSELEFDILMTETGPVIVETQRDLDWAAVPLAVREAAEAAAPGIVPARIIESRQADGAVIFELFAEGAPADPAMEVSWVNSVASVLAERWPH